MNAYNVDCLSILLVFSSQVTCLVEFDPGCEAMVFTTDGTPLQGNRNIGFPHTIFIIGYYRDNWRIRNRPQS